MAEPEEWLPFSVEFPGTCYLFSVALMAPGIGGIGYDVVTEAPLNTGRMLLCLGAIICGLSIFSYVLVRPSCESWFEAVLGVIVVGLFYLALFLGLSYLAYWWYLTPRH